MSDMEYKKYKLKELLTIKNGKDHKKLAEGDYPVYGSGGYMRSVNSFLYDRTSVLLPRKGTLSNIQYVSGNPFWTVDTIYYTILNENLYDPYYLFLYLNALDLSGYDSGASIPSMTSKTYYSLNVELPQKKIQTKVANIIRAYDNLIENNNKRIKLLEQMVENLYKEWFVRFRFPGYEAVGFENGIPLGWKIKRIKNFGQVITGKTPSTEISSNYGDKYLFIKTPDMHDNMYVIDSSKKLSERGNDVQKLKKLPRWSIMVSCIGTGGVVSINSKEAHTNQQINSIVLHDENNIEWLFFVCKSLKTTIEMFGATGSTMTNLSKGKFENLKILEPNLELINKFHMYTHNIFKEIEKLMYSNENLINQRDLLLPRLMSGKLEV